MPFQLLDLSKKDARVCVNCRAEYYGSLTFHSARFPRPAQMIDELHSMGFKVRRLCGCLFVRSVLLVSDGIALFHQFFIVDAAL